MEVVRAWSSLGSSEMAKGKGFRQSLLVFGGFGSFGLEKGERRSFVSVFVVRDSSTVIRERRRRRRMRR